MASIYLMVKGIILLLALILYPYDAPSQLEWVVIACFAGALVMGYLEYRGMSRDIRELESTLTNEGF